MSLSPLDLLGSWSLDRRIEDRRSGELLHVTGTAVLEQVGAGEVRWQEEGQLERADGHRAPVSRELRVLRDGEAWTVHLPYGAPFHRWEVDAPLTHLCGRDVYRGRMERPSALRWSVTWQVTGPAKDYRSVSVLSRPAP